MKLPISWINQFVKFPKNTKIKIIVDHLVKLGYEVEAVETFGDVSGSIVVGRVEKIETLTEFKKSIRYCKVNIGKKVNGIICGATNFKEGDLVVVALPGSVLPSDFKISERETYGKISQGMICSAKELGFSDNHVGIIVLPKNLKVGSSAKELLGLGETVLDIAVLPDRGYAMSIRGIGRELALSMGVKFIDPASQKIPKVKKSTKLKTKIKTKNASKIALVTLSNFDSQSSTPLFMQARLAQAGMRPISLPVDITNYLMLEIGQPLHAFDADKIHGAIQIRNATNGELLETLDHVKRKLVSDDLVIADSKKALSVAGIMGGLESEISKATKNIVIESAIFDRASISKTSRSHKLPSEACKRFERGTDPEMNEIAAILAAQYLSEYGQAKITGIALDKKPIKRKKISFNKTEFRRLIGFEIDTKKIKSIFVNLGIKISQNGKNWNVTPPSWRHDLTNQADLVEELIRIWGYHKIPSRLPQTKIGLGLSASQKALKALSIKMASLGSNEVYNYPFLSSKQIGDLGIKKSDERHKLVQLANPLSEDQPFLRTTLLPGLFDAALRNISRGQDDLSLFEVGSIYIKKSKTVKKSTPSLLARPTLKEIQKLDDLLPKQPKFMSAIFIGKQIQAGWWNYDIDYQWSHPIEYVKELCFDLGLNIEIRNSNHAPFHPGRCAEISVNNKVIGHAGQITPSVVEKYGLPRMVFAFEINVDILIASLGNKIAPIFSSMPVVKEDLAFVFESEIQSFAVIKTIQESAGSLLEEVRLFDVYQGANLGEGKKSLAFNLRFRAPNRTLETGEISSMRSKVIQAVAKSHGGVLRA
jgi:phenylalanyl-tRNA synthetase beta chain